MPRDIREIDEKKTSPQETLINCLEDADRIKEIVILVYTKDGWYEWWSNDLPYHVRAGLLHEAIKRSDHNYNNCDSDNEDGR